MDLLVIGKEDFNAIFMKAEDHDEEAEHVKFLRCKDYSRYMQKKKKNKTKQNKQKTKTKQTTKFRI